MSYLYQKSKPGRKTGTQQIDPSKEISLKEIPENLLRKSSLKLPERSELDTVRHYTQLSQKNFSIDTHFYPLGSCTMKYNPRAAQAYSSLPGLLNRHPLAPQELSQGYLSIAYELQEYLSEITGAAATSLCPMAGAQGELVGVSVIKAYHDKRGDHERSEMLIPDSAHGTNPASAAMCGFKVVEIPTDLSTGNLDLSALKEKLSSKTAGIMLTNPSTLGVFEEEILEISRLVHEAGGLLYCDGANLNAILGEARPIDMGFDVIHLNLHKTFATPHGGGGPGSGPVAAADSLKEFLPTPMVKKEGDAFSWTGNECKNSIGRFSAFMGNAGILLRAYIYIRLLGKEGIERVGKHATLSANYMMKRLKDAGFNITFPKRRACHEFIISFEKEANEQKVTAKDVAKRLLDYGSYAPTVYFPLLIPECFLIEPTETESKETLDQFIEALIAIEKEIVERPELVQSAPHTMPVKRLDEVKAVKELNLRGS